MLLQLIIFWRFLQFRSVAVNNVYKLQFFWQIASILANPISLFMLEKFFRVLQAEFKLIDCLRATRWKPPDYWQTDNSNGLVMVIRNYHWLNLASWVLISTCSAPLVQTGERKQFSLFDLDFWHTTLTYNIRLAKVKVDPRAKNQGQRSNGSNGRAPTDKRTDAHTDTTKRIIAPATRSINICSCKDCKIATASSCA